MGTCIGVRNLRYFITFLFRAATLALFACLITGYQEYLNVLKGENYEYKTLQYLNMGVFFYTGGTSVALYVFVYKQYFRLAMNNLTTNEYLRLRWNGETGNYHRKNIYKYKSGCCGKFRYLFYGEVQPSKL